MEYWLRRGDSEYSFDVPDEADSSELTPRLVKSQQIEEKVEEARSAITNGCCVVVDYLPLNKLYVEILNKLLMDKKCDVYLSCWRCGENLEELYSKQLRKAGLQIEIKPITAAKGEDIAKRGLVYIYPLTPSAFAERIEVMLKYALLDESSVELASDVAAIGLAPSPHQELLDVSIDGGAVAEIYVAEAQKRVDCVVVSAGGYPLDANLYLSMQPALLAANVVHEGGIIILVAECSEGIGSRRLVKLVYQSAEGAVQNNAYPGSITSLAEYMEYVKKKSRICLVSVLPKTYAEGIFGFRLFDTIQDALQYAVRSKGRDLSLYSIPHGHFTRPVIRG